MWSGHSVSGGYTRRWQVRKSTIVGAGLLLAALGGGGCARLGSGSLGNLSPLPPGFGQNESGRLPPHSSPEAYNAQAARQQQRSVAANAPGLAADTEPGMFSRMKSAVTESRAAKSMSAAFRRKPADRGTIGTPATPQDDPTSLRSTLPGPATAQYIELAQLHEKSGNLPAAEEQYRRVLNLTPNHLEALLGLARLHDRQGEFVEATKTYERAVQQHPRSAGAFNDLGLCYARQQQLDRSAEALLQAIRLQPDRKLYRNNIATVLVEQDRLPEAYDHLAAVHPPAVAHYNLGYLLSQAERPGEALEQFDLALAKDPGLEAAREWREMLAGQLAAQRSAGPASSAAGGVEGYGVDPALRAPATSRPATQRGTLPPAASADRQPGLQRLPAVSRQAPTRTGDEASAATPPQPDALDTYDLSRPATDTGYRPPSRY